MRIVIETIPHANQRYPTVGDWWTDADGTKHIRVSELGDNKLNFLVAFHELVEMVLCEHRGVTQESVDAFDMTWSGHGEPGDDPEAPYYQEHQAATHFEIEMGSKLEVDWFEYAAKVESL